MFRRIRQDYGSIKEALQYCFFTLHLGIGAAARQLDVDRGTVRRWSKRFKICPLPKAQLSPECRGIGHDSKRRFFKKTNAIRSLVKCGWSASDPEAHFRAEVLAGLRRQS